MISRILKTYAERLNEYLSRRHNQPEGLAEVGLIGNNNDGCPNKIVVSLLNLERETSAGISQPVQVSSGCYTKETPPLLLNLNIMMAAVFEPKRYADSISIFSDALAFLQTNLKFEADKVTYTLELVSLSTLDLHNIWTTMGSQYYPSVVCKLRGVTISGNEIQGSGTTAESTVIQT